MQALLLIDIQNDFLPGGALAVPQGDAVVPVANYLMHQFPLVVATQDWHPANHASFAANHPGKKPGDTITLVGQSQILWPAHCVQNTHGAAFASALLQDGIHHIIQKGTDSAIDSYSGFFDNGHQKSTGLDAFLKSRGVTDLALMGLATDYCVKFTALDARSLGYRVTLFANGCRGVDLHPGDSTTALKEMENAGVTVRNSTHQ